MEIEENNNSASRVRWLLLNALHESENITILEAWANVLLPEHGENIDHFEIVKLLNSLREEISVVKAEVVKLKVPSHLYEQYVEKALKATKVENLQSPWANYRQYITVDVLLCFSFCAYIVGKDEFSFDDSDINEIDKLISSLNEKIEVGDSDPLLKHFILLQIETLKHSLSEYRIKGTRSFKSTYITGISQIVENEELVRNNSETVEIGALKKIWEKVKSATETAAKANKSLDTWKKLIEKGSEVINYLS